MKFKSTDEFDTLKIMNAGMLSLKLSADRMLLEIEGPIIKANNSNNARFEDMYCVFMKLTLSSVMLVDFCRQGYKYYNADGELMNDVPNQTLTEDEQQQVLKNASGAYLFSLEKKAKGDSYLLIFDIEEDEDVTTYQIEFTFASSVAEWDRYSGPANTDC